jgi:hypothetical protein
VTRRLSLLAIGAVALGTLAFHIATNARYGFFRDELYFLMCGQRLAWGYVDLVVLRMIPALASAGLVVLTGPSSSGSEERSALPFWPRWPWRRHPSWRSAGNSSP